MSSDLMPAVVMATVLWVVAVVAVAGGPSKPPAEVWIVTASEKVPSHPTLVRATGSRFVIGPKRTHEASATPPRAAL